MKTTTIASIMIQVQLSSKMWQRQLLFILCFSSEVLVFFELYALDTIVCLGEKEVHGDEVNPFKKII